MLAAACNRPPPLLLQRIFSIVYVHDGVHWTAKVGEQLRGAKTTNRGGREIRTPFSDPAIVLAIFPGDPYLVVTNKGPNFGNAKSAWENPFMAGRPMWVERFAVKAN